MTQHSDRMMPDADVARANRRLALACLVVGTAALLVSVVRPYELGTWWMEVAPIFIAVPILALTAQRFPLTRLAYVLILFHAVILMVGGHYTYARVPLGNWVRDWLHLGRNHYDRLGHFAQGFVPAVITREVLLRCTPLKRGGWLFFLVTAVCLAVSACYEFVEWAASLIGGTGATEFLGTQGDVWDTQWDMFLALIGTLVSQMVLWRVHDRQLRQLLGDAPVPH
jgi:putative membrane protein